MGVIEDMFEKTVLSSHLDWRFSKYWLQCCLACVYTQYFCWSSSQPHLLPDLNPNSCGVTEQTDLFHLWGALFSTLVNTAHVSIPPGHLDLAQVAANREDWRWHVSCQRSHSHLFPGDACVCTATVKSNGIFNANWMPFSMRWRSWCDLSKP